MSRRRFTVKNRKHTALRIAILLGAVVLLAAVILLVIYFVRMSGGVGGVSELPFTGSSSYEWTGSGFMWKSGDKVSYTDITDSERDYSYTVTNSEVMMAGSRDINVLYNASALQIAGAQVTAEVAGRIVDVECGSSHIAVLRQDNTGNMAIQIFDSNAQKIDQIDFSVATPLDFGFISGTPETLWILTLEAYGSAPVSTLTTYVYDGSAASTTGVISIQDQLVENICFTKTGIFAVGTKDIMRFDRAGNAEAYRILCYGYELMDLSTGSAQPLFLLVERGSTELSAVKLISAPEDDVGAYRSALVQLPVNTLSAFVMNGELVVCSVDTVYVYSQAGKLLSETPLDYTIDAAFKASETAYVIKSGDTMRLVTRR